MSHVVPLLGVNILVETEFVPVAPLASIHSVGFPRLVVDEISTHAPVQFASSVGLNWTRDTPVKVGGRATAVRILVMEEELFHLEELFAGDGRGGVDDPPFEEFCAGRLGEGTEVAEEPKAGDDFLVPYIELPVLLGLPPLILQPLLKFLLQFLRLVQPRTLLFPPSPPPPPPHLQGLDPPLPPLLRLALRLVVIPNLLELIEGNLKMLVRLILGVQSYQD
mmetsp:Transcript_55382/g.165981  ORF Transcript_55382/g.165981 Transcript_55382/m.165981 type:complete len:221 (+) Transcript_55382:1010-1672(+)